MSRYDWIARKPVAHRGYHDMNQHIWENSPSAFARAVQHDFAIECDLQLSSDNQAVVFHDYKTDRICGVEGKVREMTAAQLTSLHIGNTQDQIPTLKDLLRQVDGKVGLVLELKTQNGEDTKIFAKIVLADLQGYQGHVALMSFDRHMIETLLECRTERPVGLVTSEGSESARQDNESALQLDLSFISFHVKDLPSKFVADARTKGLPVITWTVNDEQSRKATEEFADQMTFEGFDPSALPA